ncbi:Sjogren's syndrome/scleroderma autoantigen 1 family protein [Halohasta litorea]|uniref:Sjogren's syndrome/scleroderma autoantigen 1 family protein n=1 Tax=Halohasta litorea TaxID=869891 RepID=A0ABD6D274_9EURY|nr:Sjogren's syndrome/scleroderma autoantigen 1 family protein [Halohasta litorea]
MSDFDKEAEREKLRKKFADDEEKRASTQRMSELLLKGATMTNKHCSRCSDPLFRYDGQTFCPSCQAEGAAVDPQAEANGAEPAPEGASEEQPADPQDHETRGSAEPSQPTQPQAGQSAQPQTGESARPQAGSSEPISSVTGRQNKTGPTGVETRPDASAGDLTEARGSLTRTVTRFARAAEETDDPRRARELLAAAREAAATLAELE